MKTLRIFALVVMLGGLVVTASAQDVVSDLLVRINNLRASLGLPAYTLNSALSAAAFNQAQYMAETGQVSHTQANGSTPSSRAAAAGYGGSWVSENIYAGTNAGVGDAWAFWLNSAIHYRGMTNPNYQEIGIASASSSWGRAYVLVFGRVGGTPISLPRANSGDTGPAAPPSFVVGIDNFGNIMHEVQPEQDIGEILLTYGYTWDDLWDFLTLNNKTEADIRLLQIGEIVLVPPWEGTYTPTPLPEGYPTLTPEHDDFVATAIAEAAELATVSALTPSSTPQPSLTPSPGPFHSPTAQISQEPGRISTSAGVPAALDPASVTPSATSGADSSPTPGVTLIASINDASAPSRPLEDVISVQPQSESPWLMIAVFAQGLILVVAGVAFVRSARRK